MDNKIKYLRSRKILVFGGVLLVLFFAVLFSENLKYYDGVSGTLKKSLLFSRDTTVYADGFENYNYFKLAPYVSAQTAKEFVGEPLYIITSDGVERWMYSKSRNGGDYRIRELRFFNGRLVGKVHYYYFD